MLLKELFEAPQGEVSIIFGRFNPPHKGHKAAWELASKSPIWYVGTNKSTQGSKDPLPFDVKIQAMEAIWPEVAKHIVAEQSWLTLASMVYEKHGDVVLYVLTDEDWVTKTILQYNGKESNHGFYNFSKIEQRPTPRLSSATALRDAVMKGDREAFADAAGVSADLKVAGKPFFDLVAEYLLPYANAPKKAKKKAESVEESRFVRSIHGGVDAGANWQDTKGFGGNYLDNENNAALQLLKNLDLHGQSPIKFQDGSMLKVNSEGSRVVLRALENLKPKDRHIMTKKISRSKEDFKEFFKSVTEDAAGVGIVTKQNTTGDVNKGSIRKNLKAFKL